jgi:hypothetical protein
MDLSARGAIRENGRRVGSSGGSGEVVVIIEPEDINLDGEHSYDFVPDGLKPI